MKSSQGAPRPSKLIAFLKRIPVLGHAVIMFDPHPDAREFLGRAQTLSKDGIEVSLAVLEASASRRFFGVPMARRGIQPVWIRVANNSNAIYRLSLIGIDPNYYSPHEAAMRNHYAGSKRLVGLGLMAILFFPLLILAPISFIRARIANRHMDDYFHKHAFRLRPVAPQSTVEGFVFTPLDEGSKVVHVQLMGIGETKDFSFSIMVGGLDADHLRSDLREPYRPDEIVACDVPALRKYLVDAPATTSNRMGTRKGDPVNLVVIGDFATVLAAFCSRWDETESITLATCWKTVKAFLTGADYRYSPVSPLYLLGRSQDFALQRVRESINERLHLRLWVTPMRMSDKPVWIGQISRDIGVRLTWRTWNLTTHRIDPDVDEARDYLVEDLLQAEHLDTAGYVDGVGSDQPNVTRRNLCGDPFFTDGKRAVVVVSKTKIVPRLVSWA